MLGPASDRAARARARWRPDRRLRARAVPQLHLLRYLPRDHAGLTAPLLLLARERATLPAIVRALVVGGASARRRCWPTRRRTGPTSRSSAVARRTRSSAGAPRPAASSRRRPTTGSMAGPRSTASRRAACGRVPGALSWARWGSWSTRRGRRRGCTARCWCVAVAAGDGHEHPGLSRRPGLRAAAAGPARTGTVRHDGRAGARGAGGARCRLAARPRAARLAAHALGAACSSRLAGEYASNVASLHPWLQRVPIYATWLRTQPPGAVIDLPIARANSLPLYEARVGLLRAHARAPDGQRLQRLLSRGATSICSARCPRSPAATAWPPSASTTCATSWCTRTATSRRISSISMPGCVGTPGLTLVGRFPDPDYPVTVFLLEPLDRPSRSGIGHQPGRSEACPFKFRISQLPCGLTS